MIARDRSRIGLALTLASLVASPSRPAFAAPPSAASPPPAPPSAASPAARREASRLEFAAGNEAFRSGDYEKARLRYQAALRSERAFDVLCNLGRTEAMLGDDRLALGHLDECLKEYPPSAELAEARGKFFSLREEVRARCAARGCDAPSEEPEAPPVREPSTQLPAAEAHVEPPDEAGARWPVIVSLAAVGAVGVGVGVGFFVASGQTSASAEVARGEIEADGGRCGGEGEDPRCGDFLEQVDSAREQHTIGLVGLIGGGVLLGASALTLWLWPEGSPRTTSSSGVRWTPQFAWTPDGGSYWGVRGRF